MHPNDPNNAWVSGSQTNLNVPRSTSVDYEKETHSTSSRRLAPPPNRLSQRNSRVKPLLKQDSTLTHVSDSEAEENQEFPEYDRSARGKSPFEQVIDISKRALTSATSFYMRPRSTEPTDMSATGANGKESSYDYASEEQEYQDMMRQKEAAAASRRSAATHKRNRMSMDNKAYRPSQSDIEGESDDKVSDDGRKRRRKVKKKDLGGGPLTTLPVAGYNKRRKKKGGKGNADEGEEEGESSSGSEHVSVDGAISAFLLITLNSTRQLSVRQSPEIR